MLKKLNNKKGFTLMEMLIVVAIIAVLVAIAIPVFNGALTKSKEAADVANIRAAYADWQVAIITGEATAPTSEEQFLTRVTGTLNYNATNNNTTASNTDKLFYKDGVISYQASNRQATAQASRVRREIS